MPTTGCRSLVNTLGAVERPSELVRLALPQESEILSVVIVYWDSKIYIFQIYSVDPIPLLKEIPYHMDALHFEMLIQEVLTEGTQIHNWSWLTVLFWYQEYP